MRLDDLPFFLARVDAPQGALLILVMYVKLDPRWPLERADRRRRSRAEKPAS